MHEGSSPPLPARPATDCHQRVRCTGCLLECNSLDEVSNVGWQLFDHGAVEPLDVLEHALVILQDSQQAQDTHHKTLLSPGANLQHQDTTTTNQMKTNFPIIILSYLRHKVDCNSLASKAAGATNTVQVVLGLGGQVVVDDKGHLQQAPSQ